MTATISGMELRATMIVSTGTYCAAGQGTGFRARSAKAARRSHQRLQSGRHARTRNVPSPDRGPGSGFRARSAKAARTAHCCELKQWLARTGIKRHRVQHSQWRVRRSYADKADQSYDAGQALDDCCWGPAHVLR